MFADIALPLALAPLTYAVPAELAARVVPGARVVVPVQQREMVGVVVATDRPAPKAKARDILAVPDGDPVLDAGLLGLASRIAAHYAAPPGQVLRAMLPPALFSVGRPMVEIDPAQLPEGPVRKLAARGRAAPQTDTDADWRKVPLASVRKVAGTAGLRLVQRLAAQGAARVISPPPETKTPEQTERYVEIARRFEHLIERDAAFKRAPRQREAYEALERLGGRASATKLEAAGVSPAALGAMVKSGVAKVSRERKERDPFAELAVAPPPADPTPAQREVLAKLAALGPGEAALLFGVTGSGKTLVYLEYLRTLVEAGKGAIVLVPEIALTPQTVARFRGVFGDLVAVLHSQLSEGERFDAWRALKEGRKRVAVGARSAVFAPVGDLGAIVVDEEHDGSYKQNETPRYHARDVALLRGKLTGARVILGSATPSLETWQKATDSWTVGQSDRKDGIALLRLPERIGARPLPPVEVVDLRAAPRSKESGAVPWSDELDRALEGALGRSEQAMILLNRRGFSAFVQCPACGEVWECPRCSIALVYHRSPPALRCHHCDHHEAVPTSCRACGEATQRFRGVGTQQVAEFVAARFPEARLARMDVDTTSGKWSHHKILDAVAKGTVDILVGTQMIAKGLDFPNVTVVGVVDADVALNLPDFRAGERTFQLLTQVAGRAGRGPKGGRVIVQTRQPAHAAIVCAARHDVETFATQELADRANPAYPPATGLANVVLSGPDQRKVAEAAIAVRAWLERLFAAKPDSAADVLGPAPCPIEKVRDRYRWHLLIKSPDERRLTRLAGYVAANAPARGSVRLVVDRDPVTLL